MKTIVLDFDYTLFDAASFKIDLARSLENFGIDEKLFFQTYSEVRHRDEKEIGYKPNEHLKKMAELTNNDFEKLHEAYYKVLNNCEKYLYPDSLSFLKKQIANGEKLILLTFGNPEFQEKKVKAAKIEKYFAEIFYTDEPKTSLAHKIPDTKDTIFINDNPQEIEELQKIYHQAGFILIKRKNGKQYNSNLNQIITIRDFDELKI